MCSQHIALTLASLPDWMRRSCSSLPSPSGPANFPRALSARLNSSGDKIGRNVSLYRDTVSSRFGMGNRGSLSWLLNVFSFAPLDTWRLQVWMSISFPEHYQDLAACLALPAWTYDSLTGARPARCSCRYSRERYWHCSASY